MCDFHICHCLRLLLLQSLPVIIHQQLLQLPDQLAAPNCYQAQRLLQQ
jgi:hypothetical protein